MRHVRAVAAVDPIFGKPINFYLFTLPAWQFIYGLAADAGGDCLRNRRFLHSRYRQHRMLLGRGSYILTAVARVLHCVWVLAC